MENKEFEKFLQEQKEKHIVIITLINKERIEKEFDNYEDVELFIKDYKKENNHNVESVAHFF
jgi:hypothetical protein